MALFGLFGKKKPNPGEKAGAKAAAPTTAVQEVKPTENPQTQPVPAQSPAQTAKPISVADPAEKPVDELTLEERYEKGMIQFRAGKYDEAFPLLKRACPMIVMKMMKNKHPEEQAALAWMYENGHGTEAKASAAYVHYRNAARCGNVDGMKGVVRLTAQKDDASVDNCQTALEYARQLGDEAVALIPVLERKLADAQRRETAQAEQKKREQEQEQQFADAMTAYKAGEACFFSDDSLNYPKNALIWYEKAAKAGNKEAEKRIDELQRIISSIEKVQTGTTETDKKLANFLNLDSQERKQLMNAELTKEQQLTQAHFYSLSVLQGVKNMANEEDKVFARGVAERSRKIMLDLVR